MFLINDKYYINAAKLKQVFNTALLYAAVLYYCIIVLYYRIIVCALSLKTRNPIDFYA